MITLTATGYCTTHSGMKMDSSALEDFKLKVVGPLYTLTREILIEICTFLDIEGLMQIDGTYKNHSLISLIVKHLDRYEVEDLGDGGMAELLMLQDKINELGESSQSSALDEASSGVVQEQADLPPEQERLLKELEAMKLALRLLLQDVNPRVAQIAVNSSGNCMTQAQDLVQQLIPQTRFPHQWGREFKISGQIGEPGQKDKLRFSSLAHQIEQGIIKGFPKSEIVDAVVKDIAPGLQLCSYLEGKSDLTLPTLRRILRFHYQARGATDLTSEVQSCKESPQYFVIRRALDLRQKILFASQEAKSAFKYDPVLVQSMFLHTVLTGLKNNSIMSNFLPYLQEQTFSDELLLEKVNFACANETERQNKHVLLVVHHSKDVSAMTEIMLSIVHTVTDVVVRSISLLGAERGEQDQRDI